MKKRTIPDMMMVWDSERKAFILISREHGVKCSVGSEKTGDTMLVVSKRNTQVQ